MTTTAESGTRVELTMGEAINRALDEALAAREPMMLLGQDIGPYGGTFGVTRGLWESYGDDVVRDGPLCESGTVGFAIGLAITGVRAVVEIEFFDFVGVAMDQIFNQAAKLHYFTGGKLTVPLVIRTPIVSRMGMGPQHSQSLEAWFMHIPGIKVVMPVERRRRVRADAHGAARPQPGALHRERAPLRPPRRGRSRRRADPVRLGARRARGQRRTVVALSGMVDEARGGRRAARRARHLRRGDRPAHDRRRSTWRRSSARCARRCALAVAHDAHKTGGFGAEIAARCMEQGFDYLDAPVERVAALDVPIPCTPGGIAAVYPVADAVVAAVRAAARDDRRSSLAAALDLDGGRQGRCAGSSPTATRCSEGQTCSSRSRPTRRRWRSSRRAPGRSGSSLAEGAVVAGRVDARRDPRPRGRRGRAAAGRGARGRRAGGPPGARAADGRHIRAPHRASPAARRVARERGIDLDAGAGLGPGRADRRARPRGCAGPAAGRFVRRVSGSRSRPTPRGRASREHHRQLAADPAHPHRRRARRRRARAGAERSARRAAHRHRPARRSRSSRRCAEVPELNGRLRRRASSASTSRSPSPRRRVSSRRSSATPARSTSTRISRERSRLVRGRARGPPRGPRPRPAGRSRSRTSAPTRSTSSRPSSPGRRRRCSRPAAWPRSPWRSTACSPSGTGIWVNVAIDHRGPTARPAAASSPRSSGAFAELPRDDRRSAMTVTPDPASTRLAPASGRPSSTTSICSACIATWRASAPSRRR